MNIGGSVDLLLLLLLVMSLMAVLDPELVHISVHSTPFDELVTSSNTRQSVSSTSRRKETNAKEQRKEKEKIENQNTDGYKAGLCKQL